MLGTTLGLIAIAALLAGVVLDGIAAFARAGVHAAAEHALAAAADDAVARYQQRLAAAIGGDPADVALQTAGAFTGAPSPIGVLRGTESVPAAPSTDAARVAYTVVPTTVAPPRCPGGAVSGATGNAAIAWLQCDGYVQESRMSLHVTARILDPNGEPLAVRDEYVTLRLFAEPPYSAVAGRTDGAADDPLARAPATIPHEGDVGGDTVSGAVVPRASPYPAGGTVLHVTYACRPGSADCSQAAPPDPDGHLVPDAVWSNGNVPQP